MAHARKIDGDWHELFDGFTADGIYHPYGWWLTATPEQLAEREIAEIVEAGPAPDDVQVLGQALAGDEVPERVWTTVDYTVGEAREIIWERAKTVRDAHVAGGCITPVGRVDSDPDSQRAINGAVTGAMVAAGAGQPFAVEWTLENNSRVMLNGAQTIAMGLAVLNHVSACFAAANVHRDAINAADSAAEVFAIDIEAGYPA